MKLLLGALVAVLLSAPAAAADVRRIIVGNETLSDVPVQAPARAPEPFA